MREIRVKAIHNRTRPKVEVHVPNTDGSMIDVPPNETVRGSWLIRYDESEYPEMSRIASENEMWFIDSPDVLTWGSVTFWDPGI